MTIYMITDDLTGKTLDIRANSLEEALEISESTDYNK